MAGLQQLNWDSEGVGSKAAALVDLSTVAGNKISNPPWVKFQSAGWVNFPSAPTTGIYFHGDRLSNMPYLFARLIAEFYRDELLIYIP
ncbi:hypothetical protein N5D31_02300, partial [Pseudomonas sp. GD03867]|uniref:hypothetical protein n=1 Tax=Pseudomonas sp. GD03867 TaxID=2975393 RepID=UPI00244881DA